MCITHHLSIILHHFLGIYFALMPCDTADAVWAVPGPFLIHPISAGIGCLWAVPIHKQTCHSVSKHLQTFHFVCVLAVALGCNIFMRTLQSLLESRNGAGPQAHAHGNVLAPLDGVSIPWDSSSSAYLFLMHLNTMSAQHRTHRTIKQAL